MKTPFAIATCLSALLASLTERAEAGRMTFFVDDLRVSESIQFTLSDGSVTEFGGGSTGSFQGSRSVGQLIGYRRNDDPGEPFWANTHAGSFGTFFGNRLLVDASTETEQFGDDGYPLVDVLAEGVADTNVSAEVFLHWVFEVSDSSVTLYSAALLPEFTSSLSYLRLGTLHDGSSLLNLDPTNDFLGVPLELHPGIYQLTALASEINGDDDIETDFSFAFRNVDDINWETDRRNRYLAPEAGQTALMFALALLAISALRRSILPKTT